MDADFSRKETITEISGCASTCFGLLGVCIECAIFNSCFIYFIFKTLTYDRVEQAVKVTTEGKIMARRWGQDWTGQTLTIRVGVLYLDFILLVGWGATLKTIFLHRHQTEPHVESRV